MRAPAAPPSLLPPGRGPGRMTPLPDPPPAPARGTPLPTSPLKRGEETRRRGAGLSGIIVVGRKGGPPPFSLLPPGRGEVGRGVDPGARRPGRGLSRSRSSMKKHLAWERRRPAGLAGGWPAPPFAFRAMPPSRRKISRCDRPALRPERSRGAAKLSLEIFSGGSPARRPGRPRRRGNPNPAKPLADRPPPPTGNCPSDHGPVYAPRADPHRPRAADAARGKGA